MTQRAKRSAKQAGEHASEALAAATDDADTNEAPVSATETDSHEGASSCDTLPVADATSSAPIQMQVQEILESESSAEPASDSLFPPRVKARREKMQFYASPVPFDRHLSALEQVGLNERIRNAVLRAEPSRHLRVVHGPPGTGKTRVLAEIAAKTEGRIFACAPTNVGAANLYARILTHIPDASLLMPPSRIPHGVPVTSQDPSARVVCGTISGRAGPILDSEAFDVVLVDEAGQCMEAWMWCLLRSEVRTLIMVGDTHQLPSLVSLEGTGLLYGRSMMERLLRSAYPSELLAEQHRMHPEIVRYPNDAFYEGRLTTRYTPHPTATSAPYQIVNVDGVCVPIGTSFVNRDEARVCIKLEAELRAEFSSVVVICPYQAQTRDLLAAGLRNVHTIDSFQGQEADAVVISVVRTDEIGFWADYRRVNVALTRARHCLRIVGSAHRWSGILASLRHDAATRKCIVDEAPVFATS